MEGVLLRSRARWLADGERISNYFCNLEKRHFICKIMSRLRDNDGNILTESKPILNHVKTFFEILQTEKEK